MPAKFDLYVMGRFVLAQVNNTRSINSPTVSIFRIGQIGSVPTPWPSWLIAAHPSQDRAPSHELRVFLQTLSSYVVAFDASENRAGPNVEFIKEKFGYPEEDIRVEWIQHRLDA
jgi:hypothetical protein